MSYLVLARKWRPQTFDDLTGQEPITRIFKNAIAHGKAAHAYIFSGPRGVGKTSTARILAKALNCVDGSSVEPCNKCQSCMAISDGSSMDALEIDGASNTGVDNIRDLRERTRYAPLSSKYKVYIIDEAHMLSTSAFNALLKTLEEPPHHVIFVLATTEPKKIPPTVLSRCQHLPFRRIPNHKIKERLKFISSKEGIKAADSAIEMIARAADGSMRDSLTILDQVASFSEDITALEIKDLLGISDVEALSQLATAVIEEDRKRIITLISELTNSGVDLKAFTRDFLQFIRNLLIIKIMANTEDILEDIVDLSKEELTAISHIRGKTTEEHIALIMSELIKAEPNIRGAFYPRVAFEMTLIRLSMLSRLKSINEALKIVHESVITGQMGKIQSSEVSCLNDKDNVTAQSSEDAEIKPLAQYSSLTDIWNAALEKIDKTKHPLACKIKEGDVFFNDNIIRIVFNGGLSVHAESVKESIPAIKNVIRDLSGDDITIKVETKEVKSPNKKKLKEMALNEPIIKDAMKLFDGTIVDVIPLDDKLK